MFQSKSKIDRSWLMIAALSAGALLTVRQLVRWWREYNLHDKTVLITGGSRGLGLVMARQFVQKGAKVAICARDETELLRAQDDLVRQGGEVLTVVCDVTSKQDVYRMVAKVLTHFGHIDVLVNNAGTIAVGPMEVMTQQDYEEAMKIHFWAPFYTTLAVLPEMRRRRNGRIVNISSIGGKLSVPHLLPYSASKFALVGFSEGLRAELAKDGIVVTTVCPGLMRTGSPRNAFFKGQHQAEYTWFSISDALPFISMSAERAASQIIKACQHGDAEVVLTLPAKLATLLHGIFPGFTEDMLGFINKLLPAPGGIGSQRAKGAESYTDLSPSWLTTLSDQAAERNNEVA
ncbi:MAG: SDR family oxidoreductase [Acidobacteriota bacterium]